MSDKGYIKIDRALLDHWLWESKPFSQGQAWIDLIALANHKGIRKQKDGKVTYFKTGTISRSVLWLANRWGWDRKKVRRFLSVLEADQMVSVNATTNGTTISIVNYGKYQNRGSTNGTTVGTTTPQRMGQPLPTNNNVKNVKECKDMCVEPPAATFTPPPFWQIAEYVRAHHLNVTPERFWEHYNKRGWRLSGGELMKDWKKALRAWKEDKADGEETRGADRGDRNPRQRAGYGEAEAELFGQMS